MRWVIIHIYNIYGMNKHEKYSHTHTLQERDWSGSWSYEPTTSVGYEASVVGYDVSLSVTMSQSVGYDASSLVTIAFGVLGSSNSAGAAASGPTSSYPSSWVVACYPWASLPWGQRSSPPAPSGSP